MSSLRIFCQDYPQRTIALVTPEHALIFYCSTDIVPNSQREPPRCLVEFSSLSSVDLKGYRVLGNGYGTLGLVTLNEDVFLCVVTGSSKAATVRPGETILRIDNVDFFCLNRPEYDGLDYEAEFATDEYSHATAPGVEDREFDYPFLALKKLLSDGSFYYSRDFNLTDRLQDRAEKSAAFDIGTLDEDMLWNSYMISSLLLFRSHLPPPERERLDSSKILTCVIRGFANTLTIPASVPILPPAQTNLPSTLTIISRQASRRAGTRFNSRGIDDDGNVANFVETETILWMPSGITFSYVQVRGSVPIFWEQATGFLPGQQKIEITRSTEATQHAFNKHFDHLELEYGAVHVVNLLSGLKSGETELSTKFRSHIMRRLEQKEDVGILTDHALLRITEFDFHAEARGPLGYGASSQIRHEVMNSLQGFAYFLSEDSEYAATSVVESSDSQRSSPIVLQQEGVFRTNCLDCLDRTNLVQTILSSMALELFLSQQGAALSTEVQMRHSTLWADNGDSLSKIYAGTGALKSSFTRHGKMSLAGALADARKTATRLYVNNFSDKARQKTIELLLGRLTNQMPVRLYDPLNDMVSQELSQRASEYSFARSIRVWAGTFNVNGSGLDPDVDLAPWLFPVLDQQGDEPTIFAVGFQEIVALSPQQIMSTDPTTRKVWENAVKSCLNSHSKSRGLGKYVLLRSGQLVGAALMVFVKEDVLKEIKNVEGSVKKTGLSGISGNKGGCAIRFEYSDTRICFVTAHLAAGFANYDDRNRDYETIESGLRFQKNRSIRDHDTIIWLGDFNYRIGQTNQNVRELLLRGDYQRLYDHDQLNLQMLAGRAFHFYSEGPICFPPTYKYDTGRNEYDTSEKARVPAWCDRVLWKGSNLYQTYYNAADLRFSDHRPVCAKFICTINVIDESLKAQLRQALYDERQHGMHDSLAKGIMQVDIINREAIQAAEITPALPAASSDNHKWWLDDGAPARSTMKPPANDFAVNVNRDSNPFSSNDEPDWVRISGPSELGTNMNSNMNTGQASPCSSECELLGVSPTQPEAADQQSIVTWETQGSRKVTQDVRTAPPIPRKPISLSLREKSDDVKPGQTPLMRDEDTTRSESHLRPMKDLSSLENAKSGSTSRDSGSNSSHAHRHNGQEAQQYTNTGRDTNDLLGDINDGSITWKPLL